MPKPFEKPTLDDIGRLDLHIKVTGVAATPQYFYTVDYDVIDEEENVQTSHSGDVEDNLTAGEKAQIQSIVDRLVTDARNSLI